LWRSFFISVFFPYFVFCFSGNSLNRRVNFAVAFSRAKAERPVLFLLKKKKEHLITGRPTAHPTVTLGVPALHAKCQPVHSRVRETGDEAGATVMPQRGFRILFLFFSFTTGLASQITRAVE
jgi:hypothetical protein